MGVGRIATARYVSTTDLIVLLTVSFSIPPAGYLGRGNFLANSKAKHVILKRTPIPRGHTMFGFQILLVLCSLLVIALPAIAWEGVEVYEAVGSVHHWLFGVSSPTPWGNDWESPEPAGTGFSVTEADGDGNPGPDHPWSAYCGSDSMYFWGTWPLRESVNTRSAEYIVSLSCTVGITEDTRLSACRVIESNSLTDNVHTITAVKLNGATIEVLGDEVLPDQNQVVLQPGVYEIRLEVHASAYRFTSGVIHPYYGHVSLAWEDPASVAVEPLNWGSVKALFRR